MEQVMRRICSAFIFSVFTMGLVPSGYSQGLVPPALPFDVISDRTDLNGLVLNPSWAWQKKPGNEGKLPNPSNLCSDELPDSTDCTSQATAENLPGFPNALVCMWQLASPLTGHINWEVATYSGGANWEGISTDRDSNWNSPAESNGGLTSGNAISGPPLLDLEFASREVLANAKTSFWKTLWEKADGGATSGDVNSWLRKLTNGNPPYMVATGIFGVDCEHECHTEIHPVYAIAIQVNADPNDNTWAIFVRNWGNEGFCAHGTLEAHLPNNTLKMFLPYNSSSAPQVLLPQTQFFATAGIQEPQLSFVSAKEEPGLITSITLPDPSKRGLAELELHLRWPQGSSPHNLRLSGNPQSQDSTRGQTVEDYVRKMMGDSYLPSAPLHSELSTQATPISRHVRLLAQLPKVARTKVLITTSADPDGEAIGIATFEALCTKYNDAPPGILDGACGRWEKRRNPKN
jgi:hypothetical protein